MICGQYNDMRGHLEQKVAEVNKSCVILNMTTTTQIVLFLGMVYG